MRLVAKASANTALPRNASVTWMGSQALRSAGGSSVAPDETSTETAINAESVERAALPGCRAQQLLDADTILGPNAIDDPRFGEPPQDPPPIGDRALLGAQLLANLLQDRECHAVLRADLAAEAVAQEH